MSNEVDLRKQRKVEASVTIDTNGLATEAKQDEQIENAEKNKDDIVKELLILTKRSNTMLSEICEHIILTNKLLTAILD